MPTKVFTLADLRVLLAPLSTVRRAAIIFTLNARGTIFDTVMLNWKNGLQNPHNAFTRDIVRNQPRHLRFDYVFWEYMKTGRPCRCSDLSKP